MPPARGKSAAPVSRSALLVKRACEVEDPLAALPSHLRAFTPSALRSTQKQSAASEAASTDCETVVSDQDAASATTNMSDLQPPAAVLGLLGLTDTVVGPTDTTTVAVGTVRFQHMRSSQLPPHLLEWAFTLVKDSLWTMYEPVWGWSDSKKRQQLQAAASRFIVATAQGPNGEGEQPAAYVNFRLEPYDGKPVCYLYEVMVEERFRRLGLGQHMLSLVEQMAWEHGMDKCVLTEFTANTAAERFYRKAGYRLDPTNPKGTGTCGYMIMSKNRPSEQL